MSKIRVFIALDLPESGLKQLEEVVDELKKSHYPIRYYTRGHFHLTLKFLNYVNSSQLESIKETLKAIAANTSSINLMFTTLGGSSPPRQSSAIWIETVGDLDHIESLKKQVDKSLTKIGFKQDSRFTPHITIGRFQKVPYGKIKDTFQKLKSYKPKTPFTSFEVSSVSLRQSTLTPKGPIYETINSFKLLPK